MNRKICHENAQLSIDFLIGFTIFMLAFIFVATIISGLLISLQSKTIDYDAVAYRTGVVLAEDPGEPFDWQELDLEIPASKDQLQRLGLGIARNNPGIIQESKIRKFFDPATSGCTGIDRLCYPSDYSRYLIFGDYPYNFNISLRELDSVNSPSYLGQRPPDKYGYIRRVVGIRKPGYAVINTTYSSSYTLYIPIPLQNFYTSSTDHAYRIDPVRDSFTIYLQNFTFPGTKLDPILPLELYRYPGPTSVNIPPTSPTIKVYVDNNPYVGQDLTNNTTVIIEDGYFQAQGINEFSDLELRIKFNQPVSDGTYLDITNYAKTPPLIWAVMEVRIW